MDYSQAKVQQHSGDITAKTSCVWAADAHFPLHVIVSSIYKSAQHRNAWLLCAWLQHLKTS